MYSTQIKNGLNLTDQMVGWNDLVEIKRIGTGPHYLPADPSCIASHIPSLTNGITVINSSQTVFCNRIEARADIRSGSTNVC